MSKGGSGGGGKGGSSCGGKAPTMEVAGRVAQANHLVAAAVTRLPNGRRRLRLAP